MEMISNSGDSSKTLAEVMEEVTASLSNEVREMIGDEKTLLTDADRNDND